MVRVSHALIAALSALVLLLVGLGLWLWTPDRPRSELEARYLASPGDLITLGGMRIHVRDTGPREAQAVVLLHGFGSSLHTWEPWAEALSANRRVVRIDLPGAGLSDPDPDRNYRTGHEVALLVALLDALSIGQADLVGHSMGGKLAWAMAAAHPDRVRRLVLVSPDGYPPPGATLGKEPDVSVMLKAMRFALPRSMLRANLAIAYADPARFDDATLERYWDLMRAPGVRDAMIARLEQAVPEDPEPALARITAPVLLLWGDKDAMIPISNAEDYRRVLKDVTLVTLPDLGHVPHEEAPERSLPPVAAFLDR